MGALGKCGIVHQTATEYMGCWTCNPPSLPTAYALPPMSAQTVYDLGGEWRSEVTAFVRWHCAMCGEVPGDSKWLRTVEVGQNKFKYQHALCGSYLGDAPAPGTTPPASQSEDIYKLNISPYPSPIQSLIGATKALKNNAVWRGGPIPGIGGTQPNPSPQPAATVPATTCFMCGLLNHTTLQEKTCPAYPMAGHGSTCVGCGCAAGDPHINHPGIGPCPRRTSVLQKDGLIP